MTLSDALLAATVENPVYVTVDPRTGRVTGIATDAPRDAYFAQPGSIYARWAVRVGDVLIDEHKGYAVVDQPYMD